MAAPVTVSTALRLKTVDSGTIPMGTTFDGVTDSATVLATLPGDRVTVAEPPALTAVPPSSAVAMAWPGVSGVVRVAVWLAADPCVQIW